MKVNTVGPCAEVGGSLAKFDRKRSVHAQTMNFSPARELLFGHPRKAYAAYRHDHRHVERRHAADARGEIVQPFPEFRRLGRPRASRQKAVAAAEVRAPSRAR